MDLLSTVICLHARKEIAGLTFLAYQVQAWLINELDRPITDLARLHDGVDDLVVSALALLVGVFTQIFWEDKSIVEPL